MNVRFYGLLIGVGLLTGYAGSRQHAGVSANPVNGAARENLPRPVKTMLLRDRPGAEIAAINKTTWQGESVYEISFTQADRNPKVYVTQQGEILSATASSNEATPIAMKTIQ